MIVSQLVMEAFMAKTMALLFVLGLMVSCASYHHERGISSVQDPEHEPQHHYGYDRASSFR
jgi:hypothetical protein